MLVAYVVGVPLDLSVLKGKIEPVLFFAYNSVEKDGINMDATFEIDEIDVIIRSHGYGLPKYS